MSIRHAGAAIGEALGETALAQGRHGKRQQGDHPHARQHRNSERQRRNTSARRSVCCVFWPAVVVARGDSEGRGRCASEVEKLLTKNIGCIQLPVSEQDLAPKEVCQGVISSP